MNEKRDKKRLQEFGAFIRKIREGLGMSQDDVTYQCDLTKGNLSMIENGKKDFTFTTFLELSKGLGKHPKKLLDEEFHFLKDWE
jgi:transcriptional regulator with XRE-family HTH domain